MTSPTFTLINEYFAELKVIHIDFYREENIMRWRNLGFEEIINNNDIVLIEWSNLIPELLPKDIKIIVFEHIEENKRKNIFEMNYLAIDTSTNICSVAFLYKSKLNVLNEFNVKEHSKYLPLMSKELVEDKVKEIDFIALSIGPGSYSGLKNRMFFCQRSCFFYWDTYCPSSNIRWY